MYDFYYQCDRVASMSPDPDYDKTNVTALAFVQDAKLRFTFAVVRGPPFSHGRARSNSP